jgi:DNA repair exonuclease SbcCD nuclease subunit
MSTPLPPCSFIHIADCHIGSYKDERLRVLSLHHLTQVIDTAISRSVDFVILCGDLFNTAVPSIDSIRTTLQQFFRLKDAQIPVYYICGSHDYSLGGKTMVHLLEDAGIGTHCMKLSQDTHRGLFTLSPIIDSQTGIHLYGMYGRSNGLEQSYYQQLDIASIQQDNAPKIFLLHTGLQELLPATIIESPSIQVLPQGCAYYGAGHIHYRLIQTIPQYGIVAYPGPTFPNSMSEIEQLKAGSFVYCVSDGKTLKATHELLPLNVQCTIIDVTNQTQDQVETQIHTALQTQPIIQTIRCIGNASFTFSHIDFSAIASQYPEKIFLKNTSKVVEPTTNIQIPIQIHDAHDSLVNQLSDKELGLQLIDILKQEKMDGQTTADFEQTIIQSFQKLIEQRTHLNK